MFLGPADANLPLLPAKVSIESLETICRQQCRCRPVRGPEDLQRLFNEVLRHDTPAQVGQGHSGTRSKIHRRVDSSSGSVGNSRGTAIAFSPSTGLSRTDIISHINTRAGSSLSSTSNSDSFISTGGTSGSTVETTSTINSIPDPDSGETTESGNAVIYTPNHRIHRVHGARFYTGDLFYGFRIGRVSRQLVQHCRCDKRGQILCRGFRSYHTRPTIYVDYKAQNVMNLASCDCDSNEASSSHAQTDLLPRPASPRGSSKRGGTSEHVGTSNKISPFRIDISTRQTAGGPRDTSKKRQKFHRRADSRSDIPIGSGESTIGSTTIDNTTTDSGTTINSDPSVNSTAANIAVDTTEPGNQMVFTRRDQIIKVPAGPSAHDYYGIRYYGLYRIRCFWRQQTLNCGCNRLGEVQCRGIRRLYHTSNPSVSEMNDVHLAQKATFFSECECVEKETPSAQGGPSSKVGPPLNIHVLYS